MTEPERLNHRPGWRLLKEGATAPVTRIHNRASLRHMSRHILMEFGAFRVCC